jgi:hypothetical protein
MKKNILAENMRRFHTKNLNEDGDQNNNGYPDEEEKISYHSFRTPGRDNKEIISFYKSVKPGDSVRYVGPEKNGFKPGEIYQVYTVKSNEYFEKTVILKNNSKKIIVKGHASIEPIK